MQNVEEILTLDETVLKKVLINISVEDLVLATVQASEKVKYRIYGAMSKNAAKHIQDKYFNVKLIDTWKIEIARKKFIDTVNSIKN